MNSTLINACVGHFWCTLENSLDEKEELSIPEGMEFIDLAFRHANVCFDRTRQECTNLGDKAPTCLAALGTVLSLLDRLASCWWKCNGGEHTIEYLTGRVISLARASLRLAFDGFYDESLSLTRSMGEIANLFTLFIADKTSLAAWKNSTKQERTRDFGPAAVRRRLENLNAPVPIDSNRYAALCEVGTHVTPQTLPQGNNPLLMPVFGGSYQETGYLLALNELAFATFQVAIFSTALLKPDKEIADRIKATAKQVAASIGRVNVINGYPRLTDEAIREIQRLSKALSPEDRHSFHSALLESMNRGIPSPKTETDE